jgi:hypothetical protein
MVIACYRHGRAGGKVPAEVMKQVPTSQVALIPNDPSPRSSDQQPFAVADPGGPERHDLGAGSLALCPSPDQGPRSEAGLAACLNS